MKIKVKNLLIEDQFIKNQQIEIKEGIISKIEPYKGEEYEYLYLAPALVDIHINGGEVYHFTANPTQEALIDLEQSANKSGVAYLIPALITSSPENIFKGIETVKQYIKKNPNSGILGLHLEGPFISPEKRGAHIKRYVRKPDNSLLQEIIDQSEGVVRMITIAPEHFTDEQLEMLINSEIKVSLGHSNCSYERAFQAFNMGVKMVTHLFNAMSPFTHRQPGLAGAALNHPDVYTPLILDGDHVSFEAAELSQKIKGDKLFFISDALFLNHVKKEFKWEEFDAKLIDNKYINSDGNLAGGNLSQADCFRNGIAKLGMSIEKSFDKCTRLPAESLNLKAGKIKVGYPANFVTFDIKDPNLQLTNVRY